MNNVVYRKSMYYGANEKAVAEFQIIDTNETNPYKKKKELSLHVSVQSLDLSSDFDLDDLENLIDYLERCKDYIEEYNSKQKPQETTN